jgi:hypothetical protein
MFKRVIFIVLGLVLLASPAFPAGTCTQTLTSYGQNAKVLTFVCTADPSSSYTFPATATTNVSPTYITNSIKGWYIVEVRTSPGTPATSSTVSVAVSSADTPAVDLMGGNCATRSNSATQRCFPSSVAPVIDGALTMAITGSNTTASAVLTVKVFLYRDTQAK